MTKAKTAAARRRALGNPNGRGKPKPITLPQMQWDMGATGPANQDRMIEEPATDIDPETGKETPNPNAIRRMRRHSWVSIYAKKGILTPQQQADGERLRNASEGRQESDPLAAIRIDRLNGQSDPEADRVDARHLFRALWAKIPTASRPVIERVILGDMPIWPGNVAQRERHMERLRAGLDAIT